MNIQLCGAVFYDTKLFRDVKIGEMFRLVNYTDGNASGIIMMKIEDISKDYNTINLNGEFLFLDGSMVCACLKSKTLMVIK